MYLCNNHGSEFVPFHSERAYACPVLRENQFEFSRTRRVIIEDYCNDIIRGKNDPDIFYEDTEDILAIARDCAQTILANACPDYVAVTRLRDQQSKIMKRETFNKKPQLYSQIKSEPQ